MTLKRFTFDKKSVDNQHDKMDTVQPINGTIDKVLLILFAIVLFGLFLGIASTYAQESGPWTKLNKPFHNQLFFNRHLINPTFSLVRENKSYLNILHRNQYASYEDNYQNYYLGFSNKVNERTALGIGIYGSWLGVMQEFGFNANYATAVPLGEKSKLTFGTNITYLSEGLDQSRIVSVENDPIIRESRKENKIAIQPGIALSVGKFDLGLYARDLINYNQTTNNIITNMHLQNLMGSLQFTHTMSVQNGLFANARIMPLIQLGMDKENNMNYVGSLLLDLPDYGWLQTAYQQDYGVSLGLGFNVSKKLSLGYLMEKDISEAGANLGWNHEVSLAYAVKDYPGMQNLYANSSEDGRVDEIVKNYEEQIVQLKAEQNMAGNLSQSLAFENRLILDQLILRQDSIEKARNKMFERRFETMVRLLRNEVQKETTPPARIPRESYGRMGTAVAEVKEKPIKPVKDTFDKIIDLPLKSNNRSDIIGVNSGYYLIANVYKNKRYLAAFMAHLQLKGLDARQFYNKKNGLYYVYLADFKSKNAAENAYVSNLDGAYGEEKWIMEVYNPMATADVIYEDQ
ncbi:MAG: PorP/SprF family type IX secretion system membrane protein [Flavobacteriaceae bacterium]|nr:PorP/SprF family type IX secretion system membrane protein [Flavobacteriaceae bacterium]